VGAAWRAAPVPPVDCGSVEHSRALGRLTVSFLNSARRKDTIREHPDLHARAMAPEELVDVLGLEERARGVEETLSRAIYVRGLKDEELRPSDV
jgi:hypothetical protein